MLKQKKRVFFLEWKAQKKGKFLERPDGWERAEFISNAFFSEADLTFRLVRSVWRKQKSLVIEYMLRPDCDVAPSKVSLEKRN